MTKDLAIRNSTVEFLIFTAQSGEESIEVKSVDGTVWLSQKLIAKLFDKGRSTIAEHLNAIYSEGELDKNSTCRDFRQVQTEGDRNIESVKKLKLNLNINLLTFPQLPFLTLSSDKFVPSFH